jgi:hypothetical protein
MGNSRGRSIGSGSLELILEINLNLKTPTIARAGQ